MEKNIFENQTEKVFAFKYHYGIIIVWHIFFPLLIGAVLYLWIKPEAWCSQMICHILHIAPRSAFVEESVPLFGPFIKHQLCDVLFAYSVTFTFLLLWHDRPHGLVFAGLCAALLETVFEVAQLGMFPGNFDAWDIAAEVVTTVVVIGFYVQIKKIIHRHKENEK